MSLCIFQGTFNPIHKAHIDVANYALEYFCFEKIIFIPAYLPPHKVVNDDLSEHRLKMVKLATQYNPRFEVSDIEYRRGGKSYTYLTILELRKEYGINDKINFLIGTDAFKKIDSWYEADKLKDLLHFIVFQRCDRFDREEFEVLRLKGYDFEFADKEFLDISSTSVRENDNGTGIQVIDEYIKDNGLYE